MNRPRHRRKSPDEQFNENYVLGTCNDGQTWQIFLWEGGFSYTTRVADLTCAPKAAEDIVDALDLLKRTRASLSGRHLH